MDDKNRLAEDLEEARAKHDELTEAEAAAAARHEAAAALVEKHAAAIGVHEQAVEQTALRVAREQVALQKELTEQHDQVGLEGPRRDRRGGRADVSPKGLPNPLHLVSPAFAPSI